MAKKATCDSCDFVFFIGHNRHTSSSSCICLNCMHCFSCVCESPFGPQPGETIAVCRKEQHRKRRRLSYTYVPTGTQFEVEPAADTVAHVELRDYINRLTCPDCNQNRVVAEFVAGEPCPSCDSGHITIHPVLIDS